MRPCARVRSRFPDPSGAVSIALNFIEELPQLLIGFNSMRNPYLSSCTFQGQNFRVCFETDRPFDDPEIDEGVRPMRRDRRLGAHTTRTKRSPFPLSNVMELRTAFFHVSSCLSCALSSGILKVKIGASSGRSVKSSALGHVIFLSSKLSCPLFFPLGDSHCYSRINTTTSRTFTTVGGDGSFIDSLRERGIAALNPPPSFRWQFQRARAQADDLRCSNHQYPFFGRSELRDKVPAIDQDRPRGRTR